MKFLVPRKLLKLFKNLLQVRIIVYHLVNNMRIQLDILACSVEELATHGPLKPEEIRGLNDQ